MIYYLPLEEQAVEEESHVIHTYQKVPDLGSSHDEDRG
jgi:hypothetical protein